MRIGDIVGEHYRLRSVNSRGGAGTSYDALDERTGAQVEVTVFSARVLGALDADGPRSVLKALSGVTDPGLVRLLDASVADGPSYVVFEHLDAPLLAALLADRPLERDLALRVFIDAADALSALHAASIAHLALTPAAIAVTDDGHAHRRASSARLRDAGLAALFSARPGTIAGVLGSAAYTSPEQLGAASPGPASDVYSLGLLLLEALTGTPAFPGTSVQDAGVRLRESPAVPPEVSPPLAALLQRMTALDPAARPAAAEVARALRSARAAEFRAPAMITATATATATLPVPVARAARGRRRAPGRGLPPALAGRRGPAIGVGALATAALVAACVGVFASGGSGHLARVGPPVAAAAEGPSGTAPSAGSLTDATKGSSSVLRQDASRSAFAAAAGSQRRPGSAVQAVLGLGGFTVPAAVSSTGTPTPVAGGSSGGTPTGGGSSTPSPTAHGGSTPPPTATSTPAPPASGTPTPTPSTSDPGTPTPTPTDPGTPSPTPSASPSPEPTPADEVTPTPSPSESPSPEPSPGWSIFPDPSPTDPFSVHPGPKKSIPPHPVPGTSTAPLAQ